MNTVSRSLRLGLLTAVAGGMLCAQTPRLGLTLGGACPTGATRHHFTDRTGVNLGAFADWEQQPGHILRLALDGSFHSNSKAIAWDEDDNSHRRTQSQSLSLNYVFMPQADLQGFYLTVGAGAMNLQKIAGDHMDETGLKLAWNAGFGVDFNEKWGLLARYHSIQASGHSLGNVTAGLTYRF